MGSFAAFASSRREYRPKKPLPSVGGQVPIEELESLLAEGEKELQSLEQARQTRLHEAEISLAQGQTALAEAERKKQNLITKL